ncbi:MBL fold metallo-hydrolase [Oceanobacter sp. 4_MG-2023]|uniref:MBL fold metallo-hydrolase n=1 Tax=Oceanobacter sp. 4_MG-2023 TaxID=3062623 RepID=UPI002735BC02|nr:MBL fold metallo-hydrolase [Oceanobacter sp. 4_MG-2023]MDP2549027.1 MBL fold metallo-hydrolase [Oceanobacter sp. 4_MG-2023]
MTTYPNQLSLCFHGVGSGGHLALGSAAATLEHQGQPLLLIDCGPGTLAQVQQRYQALPTAIFMTHAHMDHIADLEILTVRAKLQQVAPIPLFVPLSVIPVLHQRLATYPGTMAEGGHNFWQSFQLLPVSDRFEYAGMTFHCYPTRHHAPGSSFALHLPGQFFYSGDTRPIPEILNHQLSGNEVVFHDCGLISNPSHTGLDDLAKEYPEALRRQLVLYHYANTDAGQQLSAAGYRVATVDACFTLGNGTQTSAVQSAAHQPAEQINHRRE